MPYADLEVYNDNDSELDNNDNVIVYKHRSLFLFLFLFFLFFVCVFFPKLKRALERAKEIKEK